LAVARARSADQGWAIDEKSVARRSDIRAAQDPRRDGRDEILIEISEVSALGRRVFWVLVCYLASMVFRRRFIDERAEY
jgi:hypothetical protein